MSMPIIPKELHVPAGPTPEPKGWIEKFKSLFTIQWSREKIAQAVDQQKRELLKVLVALDDPSIRARFGDQKIREQLKKIEQRVGQVLPGAVQAQGLNKIRNVDEWIHSLENQLIGTNSPDAQKLAISNDLRMQIGATLANPRLAKRLNKEERQFLDKLQHVPLFTTKDGLRALHILQQAVKKALEEENKDVQAKATTIGNEPGNLRIQLTQSQQQDTGTQSSVKERATLLNTRLRTIQKPGNEKTIERQIAEKQQDLKRLQSTLNALENIQAVLFSLHDKFVALIPANIHKQLSAKEPTSLQAKKMHQELTEIAYKIAERQDLTSDQKNRLFKNVETIIQLRYSPIVNEKGENTSDFEALQTPTKVVFNRILEIVNQDLPYDSRDFEADMGRCELVRDQVRINNIFNLFFDTLVDKCIAIYPAKSQRTMAQADAVQKLEQMKEKSYTTAQGRQNAIVAIAHFLEQPKIELQQLNKDNFNTAQQLLDKQKELSLAMLPREVQYIIGTPDQPSLVDPEVVELAYAIADREDLPMNEKSELFDRLMAVEELKGILSFDDQGKKTSSYALLDPEVKNQVEWVWNRARHGDPYVMGTAFEDDLGILRSAVDAVHPNVQELEFDIGVAIRDVLGACAQDPFFKQIKPWDGEKGWKGKKEFDRLLAMDAQAISNQLPAVLQRVEKLLQELFPADGSKGPFRTELVEFVHDELARIRKLYNKLPSEIQTDVLEPALKNAPQDPVAFEQRIALAKKIEKRDDLGPVQKIRLFACLEQMMHMKRTEITDTQGRKISLFELIPPQGKNVLTLLLKQVEEGIPFPSTEQFDFLLYEASKALGSGHGVQDALVGEFDRVCGLLFAERSIKIPEQTQKILKQWMHQPLDQTGQFAQHLQEGIARLGQILNDQKGQTALKVKAALHELQTKLSALGLPQNVVTYVDDLSKRSFTPEDAALRPIAFQLLNQMNLDIHDKAKLFMLAQSILFFRNHPIRNEQGKTVCVETLLSPQNKAIVDQFFTKIAEGKIYLTPEEFQADLKAVEKALGHVNNIFQLNRELQQIIQIGIGATKQEQALFKEHLFSSSEYDELVRIGNTTYADVEKLGVAISRAKAILDASGRKGAAVDGQEVRFGETRFKAIQGGLVQLSLHYQGTCAPLLFLKLLHVPSDFAKLVPPIYNRQDLDLKEKQRLARVVYEVLNLKHTPACSKSGKVETEYAQLSPENKKRVDLFLQNIEKGTPYPSTEAFEKELQQIEAAIALVEMRLDLTLRAPGNFVLYQANPDADREVIGWGRAICRRKNLLIDQKASLFEAVVELHAFKSDPDFKKLPHELKNELDQLLDGIHQGTTTMIQIAAWQLKILRSSNRAA